MKKTLLSMILTLVMGALELSAQTVITAKVDQFPPLKAVAETVAVEIPAGGITLGSDVTIEGGDGTYTYTWTNAEGQTLSTKATMTILRPGDYYLKVTDGHQCQVSVKFTATGTTGISQVKLQDATEIRLYNMAGQLLAKSAARQQVIDQLPEGNYILCLLLSDGTQRIQKITVKTNK